MSERKFDGILEYLCGDIAFKSERRDAMDELYDHLIKKYETNLACGMTEDEAEDDAVNQLGDLDIVKENLMKIHRKNPGMLFVNSFSNLTIMGYLALLFLTIPIANLPERFWLLMLSLAIGSIVWGSVSIRNVSKYFHIVSASALVFSVTLVLCYSTMLFDESTATKIMLVAIIEYLITYCALCFSLINLFKQNDIKINYTKLICSIIITAAFSIVCFYFFWSEWQNRGMQISFYSFMILPIIISQGLFYKSINTNLAKTNIKLNLEKSSFKKSFAVIIAIIVLWSASFASEYIYFYKPNDKEIKGLTVSSDSEDRILTENVMSEYGISRESLKLLPDSEIKQYDKLSSLISNPLINEDLKIKADERIFFYSSNYEPQDDYYPVIVLNSEEYVFPISGGKSETVFRLLRITDFTMPDEDYKHFSGAVYGCFNYNLWSRKTVWENNDYKIDTASETVLLADVENGKITYRQPLQTTSGIDGETIGCEFKIKRNTYLIYSISITVKNGKICNFSSSSDYVIKRKPITLKYRTLWGISDNLKSDSVSNNSISASRVFFKHEKTYLDKIKESKMQQ